VWNETHIILSKWEVDKKCRLVEVERCQDGKKTRRKNFENLYLLHKECSYGFQELFCTIGADALSLLSPTDAPPIASLSAVGFRPTPPDPHLNILVLTVQRAGGFHVNIGASELIASGAITVKLSPDLSISRINPHSIVLSDVEEIGMWMRLSLQRDMKMAGRGRERCLVMQSRMELRVFGALMAWVRFGVFGDAVGGLGFGWRRGRFGLVGIILGCWHFR
jgi:hypothetical protein